jgi:hypothetical protein
VGAAIDALNAAGHNYTRSEVGLCSALTFTCNAALAALYAADPLSRAAVGAFASGACIDSSVTPPRLVVNNVTYTGYGAFTQADCVAAVTSLNAGQFVYSSFFSAAVQELALCDADNCNMPPPAACGAARRGGGGGAAARTACALAAAGTALAAALVA